MVLRKCVASVSRDLEAFISVKRHQFKLTGGVGSAQPPGDALPPGKRGKLYGRWDLCLHASEVLWRGYSKSTAEVKWHTVR